MLKILEIYGYRNPTITIINPDFSLENKFLDIVCHILPACLPEQY